jgi:CubicO group peptidase (beta-lactamase class C family)
MAATLRPNGCVTLGGLLFLLLTVGTAAGYDGFTEVGPMGKRIVAFVREAQESVGFTGVVFAADEGKVIAAVAVGNVGGNTDDRSDTPLEVTSLFEIGSCTKPFTAIAVMQLVEAGKLNLDDSIAEHLPGIPESCRAITVRHLLQHTSGIPRTNSQGYGTDLAKVLPTFLAGGPKTTPGTRHEYWNQGYSLLSEVIAQASGKSYTAYCRESTFKPAKMQSSRFTGQRAPRGVLVTTGRSETGRDRTAFEHPYGEYGFQYRGMGGLVTSLVDLWKWDRALAAGALLESKSIKEMTTPGDGNYALGWRIKTLESGDVVHEHTGSVRGFLSSIRRNPSDDGCLFVLANSDASLPFNIVRAGCESLLEGGEVDLRLPRSVDSARVDALIGTYRDAKGRTLSVSREAGLTRAWINWHGPITRGYLGATDSEVLTLDMIKSYNPIRFESEGKIEVESHKSTGVTALTLLDLDPPLRFERVAEDGSE